MFKPKFNYTNKIVNDLLSIYTIRDFIINSPLIVEMEVSLKRNALLESAHHSTAIEGNPLTYNQVNKLAQGLKINADKKAQQEVINYINVLENLSKYIENGVITEKSLLKIHQNITHYTLENTYMEGRYRNIQVYVTNNSGNIVFTPPPAYKVQDEIKSLLEWINDSKELNPVIAAGIIHYEFVRIHPFIDGNGRTARILAALYLYIREFDVDRFFTLDEYYDDNRSAYYKALNSVDSELLDLTLWLEYFLNGFLVSISRLKEQTLLLQPRGVEVNKVRLSEKQIKIIEYIHQNGRINNFETQRLFKVSRQDAYKNLRSLVDMDLLEKKGGSRSTYYILKNVPRNLDLRKD